MKLLSLSLIQFVLVAAALAMPLAIERGITRMDKNELDTRNEGGCDPDCGHTHP